MPDWQNDNLCWLGMCLYVTSHCEMHSTYLIKICHMLGLDKQKGMYRLYGNAQVRWHDPIYDLVRKVWSTYKHIISKIPCMHTALQIKINPKWTQLVVNSANSYNRTECHDDNKDARFWCYMRRKPAHMPNHASKKNYQPQ